MSWKERAADIIREGTKDLPDDMPLKERIAAVSKLCPPVSKLCPPSWRSCSWPQKAWQSARRDYLVPFGYQARTKEAVDRRNAVISELPLFQD